MIWYFWVLTPWKTKILLQYFQKSDKVELINSPKCVSYRNHNKLLRLYDGCIEVKTGFTKASGRCLVSCAQGNKVKEAPHNRS